LALKRTNKRLKRLKAAQTQTQTQTQATLTLYQSSNFIPTNQMNNDRVYTRPLTVAHLCKPELKAST